MRPVGPPGVKHRGTPSRACQARKEFHVLEVNGTGNRWGGTLAGADGGMRHQGCPVSQVTENLAHGDAARGL